MSKYADQILSHVFRAVGTAFAKEASGNPTFNNEYTSNYPYWALLTQGLLLVTFCHLVEAEYEHKSDLKKKLSTEENKQALDLLFYLRNAFVHCQWDISKMDRKNQAKKIRELVSAGGGCYKHSLVEFEMWLDGDIVKVRGIEPMCRVLFIDAS